MSGALARHLQRLWWAPRLAPLTALLTPLAWLVGMEAARRRRAARSAATTDTALLAVPVIVVGNVIVGGAGKTPTVIALVALLRGRGWRPGIVSRGHGREDDTCEVLDGDRLARTSAPDLARTFGDEPVLMHRRTAAPIAVARRRREAARRLLERHPDIDILIADDGLQHHDLPRDIELVVFDSRGVGNGWTLPAGPLRERPRDLWPSGSARIATPIPTPIPTPFPRFVLINGQWPSAPALPMPAPAQTCWNAERRLGGVLELDDWQRGNARASPAALDALRGRRILASAGIGEPERFFTMLEALGLQIDRLPLADHADFDPLPWPAATPDVIVTEKDAVKLAGRPLAGTRVWVATLDFRLPDGLAQALLEALADVPSSRPRPHPAH